MNRASFNHRRLAKMEGMELASFQIISS
ncbi:PTS lactose/cellobiose transporter subunit IIA, partial [Listeria monocytogenes]|nr:PTS lactose/cellobiose transporter subunit IIA [Listeria monocytogenes]